MRRFSFALIVGFSVIGTAFSFHHATAQPGRPSQLGPTSSQVQPASDWLAWRVFYDSLEFYGGQSPTHVEQLLVERVGLSVNEADALLAAGREYLRQLSLLDESVRADIKARFQANGGAKLPPGGPPPSMPLGDSPPSDLISGNAPGGQGLRQALVADGLVARVTNRRAALFAAHRQKLMRALDPAKLSSLEELIRAEVAPRVKVVVVDSSLGRAGSDSSVGERTPR